MLNYLEYKPFWEKKIKLFKKNIKNKKLLIYLCFYYYPIIFNIKFFYYFFLIYIFNIFYIRKIKLIN